MQPQRRRPCSAKRSEPVPEARYFSIGADGRLNCTLCPHRCRLADGSHGLCGVRRNDGGRLQLPYYGAVSALATDPVEKKPLYHFHPGEQILSVGFLGCSLRCPFCQNYRISHSTTAQTRYIGPGELVETARSSESFAIAYTYNEPTIHFEYVLEAAEAAHAAGIKNVLVTAGNLNEDPARELLRVMDGVNIDLKSLNAEYYRRTLRADLDAVLNCIRIAAEVTHLEVTTLLVPDVVSPEEQVDEIGRMATLLAALNPAIPYHISAYHPTPSYRTAPTSAALVHRCAETARTQLQYVYTGNLGEDSCTACPECGSVLVERRMPKVRIGSLTPDGRCGGCGRAAEFVLPR